MDDGHEYVSNATDNFQLSSRNVQVLLSMT